MKWIALSLITVFSLSAYASAQAEERIREVFTLENKLQPFVSDGCSKFPDGIPLIQPKLWQLCCVQHDIAYWQGGTKEQRLAADQALGSCVDNSGARGLGPAMYLGVRLGGYTGLPLTWRWGYGWMQNRGYKTLTESEKTQVAAALELVPRDLTLVPIQSPPILVPERLTLNGDHCLDEVAERLNFKFGDQARVQEVRESELLEKADGYWKKISVRMESCAQPATFTFQLLKKDACTAKVSELVARGRVRLIAERDPKDCAN